MELCGETAGLVRIEKTLGCLPLELAGKHSQDYCQGSPLTPNKTKDFEIFVKRVENFCTASSCTKVANIIITIKFPNNTMFLGLC